MTRIIVYYSMILKVASGRPDMTTSFPFLPLIAFCASEHRPSSENSMAILDKGLFRSVEKVPYFWKQKLNFRSLGRRGQS